MGGSTDAFALYLSIFKVDRPSDASKPSTSLAFHKEAETKFDYGTATLKKEDAAPKQQHLLSHEELKAQIDAEVSAARVDLPTETIQANPTARNGQVLGGGEGTGERSEDLTVGQRRQMAVRAAEKRAQEQQMGLKAGEVREMQIRAQPAA